jgi:shikimate kinase
MRLSSGGFVAWLRAAPEVLAARASGGDHRPWLDDDPVGWFRRAAAERDPLYSSVADIAVDTAAASPSAAAEAIVAAASAGG